MNNHDRKNKQPWDQQLEQKLHDTLTEGAMEAEDPNQTARKVLPPKYEIRIQASWDPIVEETLAYRRIAKEVDDRYDAYMKRVGKQEEGTDRHEETPQNPKDNGKKN